MTVKRRLGRKREDGHGVELRHAYRAYSPPSWIDETLHRLLSGIPSKYISGIAFITLTNSGGFNRTRRRGKLKTRNRRVQEADVLASTIAVGEDDPRRLS